MIILTCNGQVHVVEMKCDDVDCVQNLVSPNPGCALKDFLYLQVCEAPTTEATGSAQLRKPAASAPARQIDARASPAPIIAAAPAQAFIYMLVVSIKILSESHYAQHVPKTSDSICPQATVFPAASTATAPQARAEFKVRDIKAEIFKSHDEVTSAT